MLFFCFIEKIIIMIGWFASKKRIFGMPISQYSYILLVASMTEFVSFQIPVVFLDI